MFHGLKVSILAAAATAALAAPAWAVGGVKDFSFSIPHSFLSDPPVMVFELKNGKYEYKQSESTQQFTMKLKAKKAGLAHLTGFTIKFESGPATGKILASSGPMKMNVKELDKSFVIQANAQFLQPWEPEGRKFCEANGKPNETVKKQSYISIRGGVTSEGKNTGVWGYPVAPGSVDGLPLHFVCLPAPFEVTDVDLTVKYHSTPGKCPVKATLSAKFKANKPGKNSFTMVLVRDNGMKQEVNLQTFGSGSEGYAVWHKDYVFEKSESRKYMVLVKGSKATAGWLPVKVSCGDGIGGFSAAPKPNN